MAFKSLRKYRCLQSHQVFALTTLKLRTCFCIFLERKDAWAIFTASRGNLVCGCEELHRLRLEQAAWEDAVTPTSLNHKDFKYFLFFNSFSFIAHETHSALEASPASAAAWVSRVGRKLGDLHCALVELHALQLLAH